MWTYFIVGGQYVKIGSAIRPLKRLKELQTGCPYDLKLAAVSDMNEYCLHEKFRRIRTRIKGEWFNWECGTIHRWLCNQWFENYGNANIISSEKANEIAETMGISEIRLRKFVEPYSEHFTEGAFKFTMHEKSTIRSGIRLFRSA
jgi:hypothetical protein